MNRFYRHTGLIFVLTGVLHVVTGIVAFSNPFKAMLAAGLVDSVREPVDHQLAFWFTFAGLLMGLTSYR